MYMRFLFLFGREFGELSSRGLSLFFLLAEQSGATCLIELSLLFEKKYTRVWNQKKQQELEKKKREDVSY